LALKHNFSLLFGESNPIWGLMLEVNTATNHYMAYGLLLVIFIVSSYVFMRKTSDIAKSFISSNHIISILTIILFYAGKIQGIEFIDELFFLGVLVIEAIGLTTIYYSRK